MKKRVYIIIILILAIIAVVGYKIFSTRSVNVNIEIDNYNLYIKKSSLPLQQAKYYYTEGYRNIYLVGLSEVNLEKNGKTISLKSYLKGKDLDTVFTDILYNLPETSGLWDGGTTIYRNKKNDITIIMCNTIDNNRDIYIGTGKTTMKENYCKRKIDVDITNEEIVKTFTSTKKIIVENAIDNTVIKEITKEKDITKIINKLSIAKEVTDNTQTTEASTWYLEFYNDDDNLVTRMWLWESGYFGYSNEKEYSLSIKDIKNIIEK